ncbi:MAG: hypothetical protein H6Q72_2324 [Firmicutes bacterium]|nr:hypothetical protein [Bacillota bacterium]
MVKHKLTFEILPTTLGVCKLSASQVVPLWACQGEFFSVTKTTEELSIVCSEAVIPDEALCERGWRALKIAGILDFSLVGILSVVSEVLANVGVSIFAISTYNTDYILVRDNDLDAAVKALAGKGYTILKA